LQLLLWLVLRVMWLVLRVLFLLRRRDLLLCHLCL
jgi:hypothetical protein